MDEFAGMIFSASDKFMRQNGLGTRVTTTCDTLRAYNMTQYMSKYGVIDIRSAQDYQICHIESSANIPLSSSNSDEIEEEYVHNAITLTPKIKFQFPKKELLFVTDNHVTISQNSTRQTIETIETKKESTIESKEEKKDEKKEENTDKDSKTNNDDNDDETKENSDKNKQNKAILSFIDTVCDLLNDSDSWDQEIEKVFVLGVPFEEFVVKYPFVCATSIVNDENKEEKETEKDKDKDKDKEKNKGNEEKEKESKFGLKFDNPKLLMPESYPNVIIEDKLYLGTWQQATADYVIDGMKITHIVNCTTQRNLFENDATRNVSYCQISLNDIPSAANRMKNNLGKAIKFIQIALDENNENNKNNDNSNNNNNKVLVHCQAGISRSSTITIAYLMKTRKMKYNEACQFVRERRELIQPNWGFQQVLREYEKELFETSQTD